MEQTKSIFKPILFSTPMVQAIIRDEKSQTRRIIKPTSKNGKCGIRVSKNKDGIVTEVCGMDEDERCWDENGSPYSVNNKYQVGDILWVRETFTVLEPEHCMGGMPSRFVFKADMKGNDTEECRQDYIKQGYPYQWKPSIFMPKDACRNFIEVTEVRVERLNEISEADALAEGIERWTEERMKSKPTHYKIYFHEKGSECSYTSCPIDSYETLWQKINGENSWSENPFVWVYTFKKIEKPDGFIV